MHDHFSMPKGSLELCFALTEVYTYYNLDTLIEKFYFLHTRMRPVTYLVHLREELLGKINLWKTRSRGNVDWLTITF